MLKKVQPRSNGNDFFDKNDYYNFLYIPKQGKFFYPNDGDYRTVFHLKLDNGETDIMTFITSASEFYDGENLILEKYSEPDGIEYGKNITFVGEIYAKHRTDDGELLLSTRTAASDVYPVGGDIVNNVYLTVFNTLTMQKNIDSKSIGKEVILNSVGTDISIEKTG